MKLSKMVLRKTAENRKLPLTPNCRKGKSVLGKNAENSIWLFQRIFFCLKSYKTTKLCLDKQQHKSLSHKKSNLAYRVA